ncbi:MAG: hypothetical protein R3D90_04940 [Paracoccaceae bacterium]
MRPLRLYGLCACMLETAIKAQVDQAGATIRVPARRLDALMDWWVTGHRRRR